MHFYAQRLFFFLWLKTYSALKSDWLLIFWRICFMQLRRWWLSCCWVSTVGVGYSPPRGTWVLPPPPVKLPRPLLQLLPEAVEADLLPGLAGGQSASMIPSSGSNPGLSRLQACLDGGDGVPITPPRPRSWCRMFSISIRSPDSSPCGSPAAGLCCGRTRDELMVQLCGQVIRASKGLPWLRKLSSYWCLGEIIRKISQIDKVDAAQSGLSVSYPARHSSTSGFKSHQTAGIPTFRLQNGPGYVKNVLLALWLRYKCYFIVAEAKWRCLGGRRRSLFSPRDSHLVPEMFSPKKTSFSKVLDSNYIRSHGVALNNGKTFSLPTKPVEKNTFYDVFS